MKYTLYCLGAVDELENLGMHIYGDDDVLGVVVIEQVVEALTRNAKYHTDYTFTSVAIQITNTLKRFRSQHEQSYMRSIDTTQFVQPQLVELISTLQYLYVLSLTRNISNAYNRLELIILIKIFVIRHSREGVDDMK